MKIKLKATSAFYRNFPEFKKKEITFISLRRDDNIEGGHLINVQIRDFIGEFSCVYFKIEINQIVIHNHFVRLDNKV
jgi:hypothetical protein